MTFTELFITTIITFGLVGLCAYVISIYTEMVRLMGYITRSLTRIDVLRCRLLDELPKLFKVCEADVGPNARSLVRLRVARCELENASGARERTDAEARLTNALDGFFATVEAHPELHTRPSFERLYHRVTDLESQIEECRSLHDETAVVFNARMEGFVERLVASTLSLKPMTLLSDRSVADPDGSAELAASA